MAITLTTDPIVSEQLVLEMLALRDDKARALINSVSASFLKYTGRSRITQGTVTDKEKAPPPHVPVLWLRATPISAVTGIEIYSGGDLLDTLAADEYTLNTDTGRLVLHVGVGGYPGPEQVIHAEYTGGWENVPGDVQFSALEMIKLQHARLQGRVGVTSESHEGHSASFEPGGVPTSVADVWRAYRVY